MTSKQDVLASVPIHHGVFTVRAWCHEDVDRRAMWPPYPPPHTDFTSQLASLSQASWDAYFTQRDQDPNKVTLTLDHDTQQTIGHIVLGEIDWQRGIIGNMGLRFHPSWCDKGMGTSVLKFIVVHLSGLGVTQFRLDVADANARAVRCYEKVGFTATERFDRDGIGFLWMEL